MKRSKRLLSLLLAMVLCLGLAPLLPRAEAAEVNLSKANFPDDNFRAYVKEKYDYDNNGRLSESEIRNATVANVFEMNITSLKGVEFLTSLKTLSCYGNNLSSLDVSKNTALDKLLCYGNNLSSLDVSKNTALTLLACGGNNLSSLDVSKNTALKFFSCSKNNLSSLDVSKNPALRSLACNYNNLTALDVSNNTKLNELLCYSNKIAILDICNCSTLIELYDSGDFQECSSSNGQEYYQYSSNSYKLCVDKDMLIIPKNPFADVVEGKYYYYPVLWAYYHDPRITSGVTETSFGVGKDCTRAQIVTFLWKAAGAPEPKSTQCDFTDVKPGKYYYKAVLWAVENKITSGVGGGKFGVGKPCEREQVMTFLWKAMGSPEPKSSNNPFSDVPENKYYYKPVLWAVENKITGGVGGGKFGVGRTCTRAQIVTFLYKAYNP